MSQLDAAENYEFGGGGALVVGKDSALKSQLKGRFLGALAGGAIGDAMGFPYEGASRAFMSGLGDSVTERFCRHRSGYYQLGHTSDDTLLGLETARSVLESQGFDASALAHRLVRVWRDHRLMRRSGATAAALQRIADGSADWQSSGAEFDGSEGAGAAVRAIAIGLWHYDDEDRLQADTRLATRMTQMDTQTVAAAVATARAVAFNLTHAEIIFGDFLDSIARASAPYSEIVAAEIHRLPYYLSVKEEDALEAMTRVGSQVRNTDNNRTAPRAALPTLMVALYYFLRTPIDFVSTVRGCLMAGGSVTTTTAIAGGLSGAFNGPQAMPAALFATLPQRQSITQLADDLYYLKQRCQK
ncbi:MAG: ADP-ribosylglycohydrolase family protein [Planctomycetota bacterium]